MGNYQAKISYHIKVLSPLGTLVLDADWRDTATSRDNQLMKQMLDVWMKERRYAMAQLRVNLNDLEEEHGHYTALLHLCLQRTHRLDKEGYSHHLLIDHSGVVLGSNRTLIELQVDLTLTGFDAVTADLLTEREILLAEEFSNSIMSTLSQVLSASSHQLDC